MTEKLSFERSGAVARTIIERPDKMNCVDIDVLEGFIDALDSVEDSDAKLLTIRGAGGVFSAGADLNKVQSYIKEDRRDLMAEFLRLFHEVTGRIETLPVPTVAAVEGYALAGGLELLLSSDIAIASTGARIGDQHANYGLAAGGGGTQRIVDALPPRRANDLMFTGRHITGETAADWGLVSRAVEPEEFDDALADLEAELASKSRNAQSVTKELMAIARDPGRDSGLEVERHRVTDINFTEDVMEGLEAFEEGREPEF